MPVLCSTGVFTQEPEWDDPALIYARAPRVPADGFEVLIYHDWYGVLDDVARHLRAIDRPCPVTHAEKSIGPLLVDDRARALHRFEANCRFTRAIGAGTLVLHLWGMPHADARLDTQLDALSHLLDVADNHGLRLAIEAIPCRVHDPLSNIQRVIARDERAWVALDTEFLAMHEQLDAAMAADWLWTSGRVCHLHIKDYDGRQTDAEGRRRYLHPGEGTIDFPALVARLVARGYAGPISLEATVLDAAGSADLPRAWRSLSSLREMVQDARTRNRAGSIAGEASE